jgi:protein required for attachment to host cells
MKVTPTWILISDGAEARVYDYHGPKHKLSVVEGANFSHINEPSRELTASERGRVSQSNSGPRSSPIWTQDPHEQEKQKFARELAEFLESKTHKFERLVLAAPPKMLGYLREHLSKKQLSKTIASIDKDLTNASEDGLERHLQGVIHIDANRSMRV